jgi:hypothetical protein
LPTPQELANQALAPVLAEIQRQQAEERRRAQQAQQHAQATAGGLAQVLGGIAPQTQATYKAAGDSTAAYAKGFSAAAAGDSNATAQGLNDILARTNGGPQQVQAAGSNMGDVLYGLGGFIPGSSLAREGAAFTAAAQNLPATALRQGFSQAGQIGLQSQEKLTQLEALLRGEKAKLPGLTNDIRAQQAEQSTKDRAQRLNELLAVENLGVDKAQLQINQQNADTSRLSAQLTAEQNRFNRILDRAQLELDQDEFGLAVQTERRLSKPEKKGGFTKKEKRDLQEIAFGTAEDDFRGYTQDDGTVVPPRPPVATLRDLIASGVPFSVAMKAIQRFARASRPQGMSNALWNKWRATLKWTKK